MNTRLHLITLAIVFAFLAPVKTNLRAQVLADPDGIEIPDGTRKAIKPANRVPLRSGGFVPLVCSAPVVNVSATAGGQEESFVVVNPLNPMNLVAMSNTNANSIH